MAKKRRHSKHRSHRRRAKGHKGHIPLKILKRRLNKLERVVRSREAHGEK